MMIYSSIFFSVWGLILCAIDKYKAIHQQYRIPEKTFMILSLLGGFPGILIGMKLCHHKVSKPSFIFKVCAAYLVYLVGIYMVGK